MCPDMLDNHLNRQQTLFKSRLTAESRDVLDVQYGGMQIFALAAEGTAAKTSIRSEKLKPKKN